MSPEDRIHRALRLIQDSRDPAALSAAVHLRAALTQIEEAKEQAWLDRKTATSPALA